ALRRLAGPLRRCADANVAEWGRGAVTTDAEHALRSGSLGPVLAARGAAAPGTGAEAGSQLGSTQRAALHRATAAAAEAAVRRAVQQGEDAEASAILRAVPRAARQLVATQARESGAEEIRAARASTEAAAEAAQSEDSSKQGSEAAAARAGPDPGAEAASLAFVQGSRAAQQARANGYRGYVLEVGSGTVRAPPSIPAATRGVDAGGPHRAQKRGRQSSEHQSEATSAKEAELRAVATTMYPIAHEAAVETQAAAEVSGRSLQQLVSDASSRCGEPGPAVLRCRQHLKQRLQRFQAALQQDQDTVRTKFQAMMSDASSASEMDSIDATYASQDAEVRKAAVVLAKRIAIAHAATEEAVAQGGDRLFEAACCGHEHQHPDPKRVCRVPALDS
ncbi:unnamed protein product, partial [Symbiodinium sp. KB8]